MNFLLLQAYYLVLIIIRKHKDLNFKKELALYPLETLIMQKFEVKDLGGIWMNINLSLVNSLAVLMNFKKIIKEFLLLKMMQLFLLLHRFKMNE